VASVEAYLRDRPERAAELDLVPSTWSWTATAVSQEHAKPASLDKVTIDDARVSTDEALLEAAFVANAQRENLSDLEEAQAPSRRWSRSTDPNTRLRNASV
jgi:ParB family chromosome partitioning protein